MSNKDKTKNTFEFGKLFLIEYKNYPKDQQDAIALFIKTFLDHGLDDFSNYKGKVTYSWKGLECDHPSFAFTRNNSLWHYHIGIPDYRQSPYFNYHTSDYILHFMLLCNRTKIVLIDTTAHYRPDRTFWLPNPEYLDY